VHWSSTWPASAPGEEVTPLRQSATRRCRGKHRLRTLRSTPCTFASRGPANPRRRKMAQVPLLLAACLPATLSCHSESRRPARAGIRGEESAFSRIRAKLQPFPAGPLQQQIPRPESQPRRFGARHSGLGMTSRRTFGGLCFLYLGGAGFQSRHSVPGEIVL